MPNDTDEAEDRHSNLYDARVNLANTGGVDFALVAPKIELLDPQTGKPVSVLAGTDDDDVGVLRPDEPGYSSSLIDTPDGKVGEMPSLAIGDEVEIKGEGFDPNGGPIDLTLGAPGVAGQQIKKLPAASAFTATFPLPEPPDSCAGVFEAQQGNEQASTSVVLNQEYQVSAVAGTITLPYSQPLTAGEYLCPYRDGIFTTLSQATKTGAGAVISQASGNWPGGLNVQTLTSNTQWIDTGIVTVVSRPAGAKSLLFQAGITASSLSIALPGTTYTSPAEVKDEFDPSTVAQWESEHGQTCKAGWPGERAIPANTSGPEICLETDPSLMASAASEVGTTTLASEGAGRTYWLADAGMNIVGGVSYDGSVWLESGDGSITLQGGLVYSGALTKSGTAGDLALLAKGAVSISG